MFPNVNNLEWQINLSARPIILKWLASKLKQKLIPDKLLCFYDGTILKCNCNGNLITYQLFIKIPEIDSYMVTLDLDAIPNVNFSEFSNLEYLYLNYLQEYSLSRSITINNIFNEINKIKNLYKLKITPFDLQDIEFLLNDFLSNNIDNVENLTIKCNTGITKVQAHLYDLWIKQILDKQNLKKFKLLNMIWNISYYFDFVEQHPDKIIKLQYTSLSDKNEYTNIIKNKILKYGYDNIKHIITSYMTFNPNKSDNTFDTIFKNSYKINKSLYKLSK